MKITTNERLKKFLDGLDDTYDEIINKTGIGRSTIFKIVKPGETIKSDYIEKFKDLYGLDPGWLFTGSKNDTHNRSSKNKTHTDHEPGFAPGQKDAGGRVTEDTPDRPKDIEIRDSFKEYEIKTLAELEQRVNELIDRIENGPWSTASKIRIIDALIRIVEKDIHESQQETQMSED